MLRSAISAFTRVFDALCLAAWCAADPGSIDMGGGPGSAEHRFALHRVRDTHPPIPEIFDRQSRPLRNSVSAPLRAKQRAPPPNESPMPHLAPLLGFALVSFGLVLTPGPNMIYLISRSITQGPAAGIVSLGGVALGFVFYMLCAAFGISALLFAVPYAYDALRFAGAAYLLWLAWQALKPNGRSPFQVKKLSVDGPRKLFAMGFLTNLLNPKIAIS